MRSWPTRPSRPSTRRRTTATTDTRHPSPAKKDFPLGPEGAQHGFAKNIGFSTDTITFGTIEDRQLLMHETRECRKLGNGKDGAYLCMDMTAGQEYALTKYRIKHKAA